MHNIDSLPSTYNPDLNEDFLILIAQLIADIRHETRDQNYDPSKGDGSWSYGCVCYQRCIKKISDKALFGEWPWLRIVPSSGLNFQFKIGETSIRFYKGTRNKLTTRTLAHAEEEIGQYSLQFDIDDDSALAWRLAIETGYEGEVIAITCVGTTASGQIKCSWEIPLKPYIPVLGSVNAAVKEPVEQPAPIVTIPNSKVNIDNE